MSIFYLAESRCPFAFKCKKKSVCCNSILRPSTTSLTKNNKSRTFHTSNARDCFRKNKNVSFASSCFILSKFFFLSFLFQSQHAIIQSSFVRIYVGRDALVISKAIQQIRNVFCMLNL